MQCATPAFQKPGKTWRMMKAAGVRKYGGNGLSGGLD
jgi:hypothetical protein